MKRSAFMTFIDTKPGAGTPTYALIGDGVTELSIAYNPQSTTEQFINQDSGDTSITGYQPNAPVTQQVKKGNAVFEYVNDLRKKRAIGEDAETTIVTVDAFDGDAENEYTAEQQKVSVQIDSFGGASTDPLSIGYTLNYKGDPIPGKFDPKTKTFTATE